MKIEIIKAKVTFDGSCFRVTYHFPDELSPKVSRPVVKPIIEHNSSSMVMSQYRHSAGPAFYDSKKHGSVRRYKKPDERINKEQRARRHRKYQVVDYE
jgi:hypothetical protein